MFLCAKACNTIVYVQNRSPHRILGDKTPKEAFTEVKPEIGHFRIFGCHRKMYTALYNMRMYKCHTRVYPTPMMKRPRGMILLGFNASSLGWCTL
jgi:hypothetical protein